MDSTTTGWTPRTGFKPGTVIADRYQVSRTLGSGGMGTVLKVLDLRLGSQTIALKLLNPKMGHSDPTALKRLTNEVVVARSLTHPNIVRIHDIGETDDGFSYITMEYVKGCSLEELIRRYSRAAKHLDQTIASSPESVLTEERLGGLPFAEAYSLLLEILQGISFAHERGVVHRDLKPANVLISEEGEVKIVDFGLARMHESEMGLTKTGETVGTPTFMAPEQFRGEKVDARCDIYALSIIAYQMVTGELPFSSTTYVDLAMKHMNDPMPNFATGDSGIPLWFQEVVQKAGEKRKEDRYQSVDEFRFTLAGHKNEVDDDLTEVLTQMGASVVRGAGDGDDSVYRMYSRNMEKNAARSELLRSAVRGSRKVYSLFAGVGIVLVLMALGFMKFSSDDFREVDGVRERKEPKSIRNSVPKLLPDRDLQGLEEELLAFAKLPPEAKNESSTQAVPREPGEDDPTVEKKDALGKKREAEESRPAETTDKDKIAEETTKPRPIERINAREPEERAKPLELLRNRKRPPPDQRLAKHRKKGTKLLHRVNRRIARHDLLNSEGESYRATLSPFGSGRERDMMLNLKTQDSEITGHARVFPWGKFEVKGEKDSKGLNLVLRMHGNPTFKIKLNGVKEHNQLRGSYSIPDQEEKGAWKALLID